MPPKKKAAKAKAPKPKDEVVAKAEAPEDSVPKGEEDVELAKEDAAKDEEVPEPPTAVVDDAKADEAGTTAQPNGTPASTTTKEQNPSKKRKAAAETSEQVSKAARRSGRGAKKSEPTQEQLLNFLLSRDAEELCRPDDETEDIKRRGNIRTYSSSVLNPFEELLCAVVLSRPISHRLGLRSIRTILNAPYNFHSAQAVQKAGKEKHHQALLDARTQHKGKTADEIGLIADVALEKLTASGDKDGSQLQKALDNSGNDIDKALQLLKTNIKGLGNTGLDIFLRRVQWLWTAGYPFADPRTVQSLKKLGLPDDSEDLRNAIEGHWKKLQTKHLAGDDEAARKRRAFVVVLERAVGSDLENRENAVLEAAAAS